MWSPRAVTVSLSWVILSLLSLLFPVRKPRNDSRNYRYIELPNELRALLVSDPECDEAAASMRVGVGSMSDPPKIPGLAHFTEHMLFQGSKRFPGTHDFFDFVHNHGGYTNAFTSKFSTVFSFSIGPGFLEPGLDRLADLFSAPLLKSENLLKEVNAVHSEYIIDLTDDGRRKHHLIRQTAKGGPFSNFTVGNLESLMERTKQQGIDPVKAMREFHNKWYSSNLMTLAVVGRESLDVLESHVRKHFGNVPNGRVTPPVFEECSEAFIPLDPNELGTETLVVPEADLHDATFVFYLPPQAKNWRSKPLQFISEMLEHEGPTSLSSKLKREGLITSLVTDYWSPELCTVLQVNVRLTEGGRSKESVYKIGHALFTFLRNLGVSRPERWRVTEMAKIRQLGFTFADMPDPYALTVRAVEGLNYYTPEEVIAGDRLIYHFDPDIIQQYVQKFLVPDNVRLFIFDKKLAADVDREEYWFKIKHGVEPIMDSVFKKWKEITSAPANTVQSMMRMEGMALPAPNRFLPNNVAILPRPPGSGQGAEKSAFPEPLVFAGDHICANKCAVFHKQDTTFHSPKAVVELQIYYTGSHEDGVRERILTALYVQSLRFALRERFADTHRAGMSLGLGSGVAVGSTTLPTVKRQRVLTLSAAGFSDKLDYVLRAFAKSLAATEGASDEKPIPSPMELGVTMSHGVRHLMHSRVTAPSNVLASVQSSRVYTTAVRLPGGGRAARRTLTHDQITTMHRKPASMDVTLMRTPVSSLGIRIVGGRAEREATPVVAGGGKPLLEKRFFRLAFDQLRTDLRVATLNRTPLAQANDAVLELIMHPHVPVHKMYAALFEMEKNHPTLDAIFEEVADWGVKLWNEAAVEGLVQGNITSESATQLVGDVISLLPLKNIVAANTIAKPTISSFSSLRRASSVAPQSSSKQDSVPSSDMPTSTETLSMPSSAESQTPESTDRASFPMESTTGPAPYSVELSTGRTPYPDDLPTSSTPYPDDLPTSSTPYSDDLPTSSTPYPDDLPTSSTPYSDYLPTSSTPYPDDLPTSSTPYPDDLPTSGTPYPDDLPTRSTPAADDLPASSTPYPDDLPTSGTPYPDDFPTSSTPYPDDLPTSSTPYPDDLPTRSTPAADDLPTSRTPYPDDLPIRSTPSPIVLSAGRAPSVVVSPIERTSSPALLPTERTPLTERIAQALRPVGEAAAVRRLLVLRRSSIHRMPYSPFQYSSTWFHPSSNSRRQMMLRMALRRQLGALTRQAQPDTEGKPSTVFVFRRLAPMPRRLNIEQGPSFLQRQGEYAASGSAPHSDCTNGACAKGACSGTGCQKTPVKPSGGPCKGDACTGSSCNSLECQRSSSSKSDHPCTGDECPVPCRGPGCSAPASHPSPCTEAECGKNSCPGCKQEEEKLVQLRSIRKNLNPNDKKNQAYLLIEVGALPNIHDRAVLYMVSRWMSQRFFNKLRTEQQLGYLTAMHSSRLEDRFYYRFFITSTYDPAEVADRIVEFINAERSKIPTQEEFATLKQAAIDVWKQKPKNIFEEFRKNRRQVVLGDRLFDINERMVAELERVTPEEIQSFKEKTMFNASWLLMEVYSQREKPQMLPQANGASGESKLDPWVDIDPELLSNITVPDMESD
uniref:M16 family peptidase, putative n=1 Tax=Toxoplasma gondii (strain ATCC 50861 / VEG) TaxID=432359 RepID=A0A0F7UYU2_TOXGV|nr:TPA: M16 family peptidase, putative [Toxoplasma gondii VEG]